MGRTHGMKNTSTYRTWRAVKMRCLNPKATGYAHYGAAGIKVCDRWRDSFEAFLEDMGVRPEGKSIDRIDNEKGYEPGNCRWATPKEQIANRRPYIYHYARQTQCKYGHPYIEGSYTIRYRKETGAPHRWCRACEQRRSREKRERLAVSR